MWTSSAALQITPDDKGILEHLVRSGKTEQRIALRARIVLGAAAGTSNHALAKELQTSRPTIIDWRRRFAEGGIAALYEDRPRGRSFEPLARAKEAEIIAKTQGPPPQATQWSCSSMAKVCGVSSASVQRVWHANGLKPHLIKTFKLSNDPDFIEKLEDVVGLYMNPPEHALVLCIDEKSQIQALDRTQPGLPMKPGRAGTMTHDYKRNGTTTLFAALDVLKGEVIGRCMPRHRHQEFLKFLQAIDRSTPKHLDIHCIADNYATHKKQEVSDWLAKNGVRLISITQDLGDDPMSVMMRQIMTLFDEYQSKENAKHTLRAMKENARQSYWNGALPPIGDRIVAAEQRGATIKKKLEIDPIHADTLRLI